MRAHAPLYAAMSRLLGAAASKALVCTVNVACSLEQHKCRRGLFILHHPACLQQTRPALDNSKALSLTSPANQERVQFHHQLAALCIPELQRRCAAHLTWCALITGWRLMRH